MSIALDTASQPAAEQPAPRAGALQHPVFGAARLATVTAEGDTRYRVQLGEVTIGYLEAAGPVWVSLAGSPYSAAVEIAQSRIAGAALRALTDHAA
jgi:hypothetical protein